MKTIIIDDKKIEISDESYEALEKQFVTRDKAILWKPEIGQTYYYVDEEENIDYSHWNNCYSENLYYDIGNIFRTEEEAEEALETGWRAKRKAEVEILRFIAENGLEYSWIKGKRNYLLVYCHLTNAFIADSWESYQHSILPYFKSEADAQKVIDAMTPQLKILFGVR